MNNKQRVLFVVLAIVGVLLTLQINGALAADPKKCVIPHQTEGAFMIPGEGFGMILYFHENLQPQTITVLEELDLPGVDENGKETTFTMYRFDGEYDKVQIYCGGCRTGHTLDQFPFIPPIARKNMVVEKSAVTCK